MPDPPPASAIRRPFWLMRVLAATMRQGAYLTPKLFVPRDVWYVQ